MMRGSRLRQVELVALATVSTVILVFPIYWAIMTSLLPTSVILSPNPPLVPSPSDLSFDAYIALAQRPEIRTWILNTVLVTVGASLLTLVISVCAGYSLSRFATRGHSVMGLALLYGRMLPGTLLVIPLFLMFGTFGLTNSLLGLVLANTTVTVPFTSWMMKAFFDSIPKDLEDAAMVDGCGRIGALTRVILPLSTPGLAATAVFAALLTWGDYLFVRTFNGDSRLWTITVGILSFQGEYGTDWNGVMAFGIVSILPIVLLFVFLERYLVSGMTAGSVTG